MRGGPDITNQAATDAGAAADITAIRVVTDAIPDAGALTSISDETDKIADADAGGLGAADGSLAYGLKELERHIHNRERWWGAVAVPDETNAIAATVTVPFVAASGADTWGTAIPILGTGDDPTPAGSGDTKFDIHRLLVTDLDDETDAWRFRVIWGTGTSGAAITAEQWSEIMLQSNAVPGNRAGGQPIDMLMRRVDVGAKL